MRGTLEGYRITHPAISATALGPTALLPYWKICSPQQKQGKKVCKATALRSCHCFPCTMLSVLSRANWSLEKSYSAQLLTAAERCKNALVASQFNM